MHMKLLNLVFLLEIWKPVFCRNWSYTRMYDRRICNNEQTCHLLTNNDMPTNRYTLETRNCMCDEACAKYKDCCFDTPFYKEEENELSESVFYCPSAPALPIYMKVRCPTTWSDEAISIQCSKSTSLLTSSDASFIVPVTSLLTNTTYGNQYCAVCHGDNKFELWTLKPSCGPLISEFNVGTGKDPNTKLLSVDFSSKYLQKSEEIWKKAVYDANLRQFTSTYDEKIMICHTTTYPPTELKNYVRICIPDVISSCPAGTDPVMEDKCKRAMSVLYLKKNSNVRYRNIHCVTCNGQTLNNVTACPIIGRSH